MLNTTHVLLLMLISTIHENFETVCRCAVLKELFEKKEYVKLLEAANRLLTRNELTPNQARLAFRSSLELNDNDLQEFWLDIALEMNDNDPWLLYHKARRYHINKDLSRAEKIYLELLENSAFYIRSLSALSSIYHSQRRYDEAARCLCKLVSLSPDDHGYLNRLFRVFIALSRHADAAALGEFIPEDRRELDVKAFLADWSARSAQQGRAPGPLYYDIIYKESESYRKSGEKSIYAPVWEKVISIVKERGASYILDLGCGPGQFADFIHKKIPAINYCGVDFSESAIELAKSRGLTKYNFIKAPLPLKDDGIYENADTVVCLEVLEHIDNDLDVIESIPSGKFIIASVPNFDSLGHIRYFNNEKEVVERYGHLFIDLKVFSCPLSGNSILWLMHATRA